MAVYIRLSTYSQLQRWQPDSCNFVMALHVSHPTPRLFNLMRMGEGQVMANGDCNAQLTHMSAERQL